MSAPLTGQQIARGKRMLDRGATWRQIATEFNTSYHQVQLALQPGYAEKRRAQHRARYRTERPVPFDHGGHRTVTPSEAYRALATVPPDTRDLTARLCGDPLPGRSALERRAGQ